ncbi:MAG: hypothetical protein QW209_06945, partial [Nitrososphaerota archaeon]
GNLLATSPGGSEVSIPSSNSDGTLSVSWFQDHINYPIQNNKPYMIWGTTSATFQYEPKAGESDPPFTMYARLVIGYVESNGNIFTLATGSPQVVEVSGSGSFTVSASFNGFHEGRNWGPHSRFVCNDQPNQDALYMRLDVWGIPLRANQTEYPGIHSVVLVKYNTSSSFVDWSINYNLPHADASVYNSPYKSLKLYYGDTNQASRSVQQKFSFTVSVPSVRSFWWWDYAPSQTSYVMQILYSDDTVEQFLTTATSVWTLHTHFQSELNQAKSVVGVRFETASSNAVYIDNVAFNFNYGSTTSYVESDSNSVSIVEEHSAPSVRVKVKYTLLQNSYVLVNTTITNEGTSTLYDFKFRNSLDGLDTLGAGYKYIYFPGVGWVEPGVESPQEFTYPHLTVWRYNYLIAAIKRIPDWIGSYGIGVIIDPVIFSEASQIKFTKVINTRYFNSSTDPSPQGFLHWLQFEHSLPPLSSGQTTSYNMRWVFMTACDYTNPSLYDQFFSYDNIDNPRYRGLDYSNNFYYGEIIYELVNNYAATGDQTVFTLAKSIWNYYWRMLNAQSMGTYVPSLAQFVRASFKLYDITSNSTYLSIAYQAADKLKEHQVTTPGQQDDPGVVGTFRMKGEMMKANGIKLNETSYLDVTASAIIALREAYEKSGNTAYFNAVNLGLSSIHYSSPPSGFTPLPLGVEGSIPNPTLPRIWIYANGTHIDHDYSTYKAFLVMEASMGLNNTLTLIGLSRFWQRTVHNGSLTEVHTGEWSSPNIEMNSETQPWGIYAWYKIAQWMASQYEGVFIEFIDFPDNDNPHLIESIQYHFDEGMFALRGVAVDRHLDITVSSVGNVKFRIYSPTAPTLVLFDGEPLSGWTYNVNTGITEANIEFASTHTLTLAWASSVPSPAKTGEYSPATFQIGFASNVYDALIGGSTSFAIPFTFNGTTTVTIVNVQPYGPYADWLTVQTPYTAIADLGGTTANLPATINVPPGTPEGTIEIPVSITAQSGDSTLYLTKTLRFNLKPYVQQAAEWMPYLLIAMILVFIIGAAAKKR